MHIGTLEIWYQRDKIIKVIKTTATATWFYYKINLEIPPVKSGVAYCVQWIFETSKKQSCGIGGTAASLKWFTASSKTTCWPRVYKIVLFSKFICILPTFISILLAIWPWVAWPRCPTICRWRDNWARPFYPWPLEMNISLSFFHRISSFPMKI